MKLMTSGVTFSAAMVRSPSFSRSSSSTTTTIRPFRMSSMASGMLANGMDPLVAAGWRLRARGGCGEPLDVLRDHVHLQADAVAGSSGPEGRVIQCIRDDRDRETAGPEGGDGQRDAVHRDRAPLHEIALQPRGG